MRVLFFKSDSCNPYRNLAIEELLMEIMEKNTDSVLLYLWQNGPSVILGRNQNPFVECDVDSMRQDAVELVRRKSGGGAVYHDLGNLNYTVISHSILADKELWTGILCNTVRQWGLKPEKSGRNDITVEGKKFSGTAFSQKNDIIMQHGTIMVNVELDCMERYLRPNISKLQKRGIKSLGARVLNLADKNPDITVEGIAKTFISQFHAAYTGWGWTECCTDKWIQEMEVSALEKEYSSKAFLYGNMMDGDLIFKFSCSWGIFSLEIFLEGEAVKDCEIYTDALDVELVQKLREFISGKSLKELKDFSMWEAFPFSDVNRNEIREFSQNIIRKLVKDDI